MALCLANPDEITVIAVKSAIKDTVQWKNKTIRLEIPDKKSSN
jgi:hypothetical protein